MLKQISHDVLYRGKVIDLVVDQIEYPSGNRGVREIARHPGGAVALPLLDDGTVLLVEQYRYPLKTEILELPAGKLSPGEDPLQCARRELEEETGWSAATWESLGSIYTTPGFSDEVLHLFLATDLTKLERGPDRSEGESGMRVHRLNIKELVRKSVCGGLHDAKTLCAILLYQNREEM
ncbi:MAG: NUDIX hydrolase [Ignavibacteria bacterium]|nr:NUDIX hydrolase [Ignavibacteria bacterium]